MTKARMELTILMPCLDEAQTIRGCVLEAQDYLRRSNIHGEVLVADNGSTDGSQTLAAGAGARVIAVPVRGYGAALQAGITAAKGRYVIMADADASYDFSRLDAMVAALRAGNQLVMGNRFRGGISPGAMPFLHRYLGNPVLSFLGRLFYRSGIGDFHCGLRGFEREAILGLHLCADGMEFASEMVVKSTLQGLRIAEVPITLRKDGRNRPPHLRTWRDGWRHLRFLLLYSPRWLFLIPGMMLLLAGLGAMLVIGSRTVTVGGLGLDIHTLSYAGAGVTLGVQMMLFAVITKLMGAQRGWLPVTRSTRWIMRELTLERCLLAGGLVFLVGVAVSLYAVTVWVGTGFGSLEPRATMRWVIPSVTLLAVGGELALSAFVIEALRQPARGVEPL